MHSWEEHTVSLNHGSFAPVVFSALGVLPVDGTVRPSLSDVKGVPRVCDQLRLPPYGTLLNKVVGRLMRLLWQQLWSQAESSKDVSVGGGVEVAFLLLLFCNYCAIVFCIAFVA